MRAYFDHNATTPVAPAVWAAMGEVYRDTPGNASSIHSYGQAARQRLEAARRQVAAHLNARPDEIVFTSGGTEANNIALFGLVQPGAPGHFITQATEHPAVLNVVEELRRLGESVTIIPVDSGGLADPGDIQRAILPNTRAISVMAVNNETGVIQPIREIAKLARTAGVLMHTDAVQAPGRLPIDVRDWGVDLLSLSAHKLYGPKGVGALYVRKGTPLRKRTFGGHHERDRRPGTENVPGAVGFGVACEQITLIDSTLRDRLEQQVLTRIPDCVINGDPTRRAPNVTNLRFSGIEGESLVIALDLKGFAVSSGSACSSGSVEPSPVLLAMGQTPLDARSAIRISLGAANTAAEVDALVDALVESVARLRKLSTAYA